MRYKNFLLLLLILFSGLMLFVSFNMHRVSGYFNYHSQIYSDRAGYYVYLPALFEYEFKADRFPDSVDVKTGHGFQLDHATGKVKTKYTYGIALMQLPFYLMAEAAACPLDQKPNGFSPVYHRVLNVAAVFYLMLGLVFLRKFLKSYFKEGVVLLLLITILSGTNLFYYAVDAVGMSHVYSFALFCIYLYLLKKTGYLEAKFGYHFILLFAVAALIILIRPSNLLFVILACFIDAENGRAIMNRLSKLLRARILLYGLGIFLLVFLPQMLYWYYLNGSMINYSYDQEGFNWLEPRFAVVLIAPENGLLPYNPLYLFILASFVLMIKKRIWNGLLILVMFALLLYMVSSWWAPTYGCSFGARNFVEYIAVFSIPLGYWFKSLLKMNLNKQLGFWILLLFFILVNLKLTYTFDDCFFGTKVWDWNEYFRLLLAPLP
ncbi:MAG: hypothetical protein K9G67_12685 [Bacteroidales bacterium]|nr:hypothetical protein [Bacteroidales bacterium]MCF8345039.1 hypothetical protein [Bacteroidales bacterium]MCF8352654.1 hypothetical protein [Bacteroidales bacterium]MCF8377207.1 hypothetical protein [Bacteroidales bacterium]MCF8401078.1 hypothetical protein [Bacteroidales bacterium]